MSPRLLRAPPRPLALPLRRALHRGPARQPARHRQGRRPRAAWFAMVRTYPARRAWGRTQTPHRPTHQKTVRRASRSAAATTSGQGIRYVPVLGRQHVRGADADAWCSTRAASRRAASARTTSPTRRSSGATRRDARLSGLGHVAEHRAARRRYREFGVRVLGVARLRRRGGHAARRRAGAGRRRPTEAAANLRATCAERYDLYGDFGFYDAVDPDDRQGGASLSRPRPGDDVARGRQPLCDGMRAPSSSRPTRSSQRAVAILGDERFFE